MSSKYEELDSAIIHEIDLENKAGSRSTVKDLLACARVAKKIEPHTEKSSWPQHPDYRVIDARVQALRKAGRIAYMPANKKSKAGWSIVSDLGK